MKGPYKVFETSQDLKDALGSERTKEEIAEDLFQVLVLPCAKNDIKRRLRIVVQNSLGHTP